MKKVFGMINKKKGDESDEDFPSYTEPTLLHGTEPPASRNSRGILQPHYPPPRPCHNSPNARRRNPDTSAIQGNKKPQLTENNRNSSPALVTADPKRAPPRINIAKKTSDADDYCDPIDVQRKDDYIQEIKSKPIRDDYCEPWDSTTKTTPANISSKHNTCDDEHNEYLDPYDTGIEGIIEKRMSRSIGSIGREFGVQHGKAATAEQRRGAVEADHLTSDPSKAISDDYDMPWEWKQKLQGQQGKMKVPKPTPQTQRPKSNVPINEQANSCASKPLTSKPPGTADDYDEPWENKQSYLRKTNVPAPSAKSRSPVPLPRQSHPQNNDSQLYEKPWDTMNQSNDQQPQEEYLYAKPWDETGSDGNVSPRRYSQPSATSGRPGNNGRKLSQPVIPTAATDDYDTPWEYKNKPFGTVGPPKPMRIDEIANIDPDLPLSQQSWYHGPLTRQDAEELLRGSLDCSFLVRNSESSKRDFSLSMKNNDNFLHLKIVRQLDGQFILGQFSKPFMDIPKVISHYSKNKLNIRGAEHKFLKHPVSGQPEYHIIEPEEDVDVAL